MPTVQRHGDRAGPFAALIEIKGDIINHADIRDDTAGTPQRITNTGSMRTDPADTYPDTATTGADLTDLFEGVKDTVGVIVKSGNKTTREIAIGSAQVDEDRCRQGNLASGEHGVGIAHALQPDRRGLVLLNQEG